MHSILNNLVKNLSKKLRKNKNNINVDIFELVNDDMIDLQEKLLFSSLPQIKSFDKKFNPFLNPIFNRKYLLATRKGKSSKINHQSLIRRNLGSYKKKELEKVRKKTIAIIGVGACGQIASMLLARSGFEKFILADGDKFEADNVSTQPFCFNTLLGNYKVDVTKKIIMNINSNADVKAYRKFVDEKNIHNICNSVDYIHDGVDDYNARVIVHRYARDNGIPWFHSAVSATEGRYTLLMPSDPPYEKIFNFSRPDPRLGIFSLISPLIITLKVNDMFKMAIGKKGLIRYPKVAIVNMKRTNPILLRKLPI